MLRLNKRRKGTMIGICFTAILLLVSSAGFAVEKTVMTFLWWGGNPNNFYETAKAEFESLYPNIQVELVFASADDQVVKVAAGIGDAVINHTFTIGSYLHTGTLMPLNSFLEKDPEFLAELQKDFWPGSYRWAERDGSIFTLPLMWTQGLVLFYNKDKFNNAGLGMPSSYRNWNDMLLPAKKLSTEKDNYGIQLNFNSWNRLHWFSMANGAGLFDNPMFPTKSTLSVPQTLETANFWANLATKEGAAGGAFAKGTSGMLIGWWGAVKSAPFNFDMTVVPLGPSANTKTVTYPAALGMMGITANAKHPAEAYLWLKFLLSPRMVKLATMAGAGVPTRRSVTLLPEWLSIGGRNNMAAVQALMTAVPEQPLIPYIKDIDALLNPQLAAAFKGETDIDAMLKNTHSQLNELIQRNLKK